MFQYWRTCATFLYAIRFSSWEENYVIPIFMSCRQNKKQVCTKWHGLTFYGYSADRVKNSVILYRKCLLFDIFTYKHFHFIPDIPVSLLKECFLIWLTHQLLHVYWSDFVNGPVYKDLRNEGKFCLIPVYFSFHFGSVRSNAVEYQASYNFEHFNSVTVVFGLWYSFLLARTTLCHR